jgi:multisubunit Na+/H+ antiporter MnhG subunit
MTKASVGRRMHEDEPPTGWGVLLALLGSWGITLRLVLLIMLPITAVVGIVALVAIYLGPVGVGALITAAGGGYGAKRLLEPVPRIMGRGRGARS